MSILVYILTLIGLLFIIPNSREAFSPSYVFFVSIIYFLLLIYFFITQKDKRNNWMRFDVIFLIGYSIVHIQIPFLASIGSEPPNPSFIWINKNVVNYATWLSVFSINLWMIGNQLSRKRWNFKKIRINKIDNLNINFFKLDLCLGILFVAFLALVGRTFYTGEVQGAGTWGQGSVYIYLIFGNILTLRIIYFIYNLKNRYSIKIIFRSLLNNKVFFLTLTIHTILFLLNGDRGPVMNTGLAILGAYAILIKPIKFRELTLLIISGAFIFTLIGLGRGAKTDGFGEKNIFERGYEQYNKEKDETNISNELASSVRVQYRALDVVPEYHPYLYGSTYLFNLTNLFPFAGSTIINTFNIPTIYTDSSTFFTYMGQGKWSSWGEGSELLGDMYINFGVYGVYILMFIFGYYSNYIYIKANELNITYIIIYIGIFMSAIYINRSYLLFPLKDIVYMLFFNYIFTRVIK